MTERDLAYQTVRLFYGILFLQESIGVKDVFVRFKKNAVKEIPGGH